MVDKFQFGSTVVTGGAGFIGSHIVDKLISNDVNVKVLDNLSNGRISNLNNVKNNKNFGFLQKDLGNLDSMKNILIDVKSVFHIAAYPEVRTGFEHPEISYKENIENTFKLLEATKYFDADGVEYADTKQLEADFLKQPSKESKQKEADKHGIDVRFDPKYRTTRIDSCDSVRVFGFDFKPTDD